MLVLSRQTGQSIVIDDRITVTVVGRQGQNVRLGIEAPKEIPVRRHELTAREQRGDVVGSSDTK
jgi:carbon storage regulator